MNNTGRNRPGEGPNIRTPLSLYFHKEWKRSGLTFRQIARDSGVSLSMVSKVIQGERGGQQARGIPTIRAIATAMGLDPDEAERLANIDLPDEFEKLLLANPTLSRAQKKEMQEMYRRFTRRKDS